MTVPNIFANQAGPIPLAQLDANFAAFQLSSGAGQVGTILPLTGAALRTQLSKNGDFVNVKDFGSNIGSGGDDTAVFQAAVDGVYAAGGGTIWVPPGTYKISSIVKAWSSTIGLSIIGAGKAATIIQKTGGTTTPLLQLTATGFIDMMSTFSDFTLVGSGTHTGIQATNLADSSFERLFIVGCNVGFDNLGCIACSWHDDDMWGNVIGYRCQKANSLYANANRFVGCGFNGNTDVHLDLTETNSHWFYGTRFETGGTAANTATGGVRVRAGVSSENAPNGFTHLAFKGCYFEAQNGTNFSVANPTNGLVFISFEDTPILNSEAGRALNIGTVQSVSLKNVSIIGGSDVAAIASNILSTDGCDIATITYTGSGVPTHVGLTTSAGTTQFSSWLTGSAAYDPPSLADGVGATTTVTATGAALGDFATATFSLDLQGITVTAWVSSANTVSVRFQNESGGALDLASGTLRVRVSKP